MAASNGLIEARFFSFLYCITFLSSDFDWFCGRLHDFIRTCIKDSLAFNIAFLLRFQTYLMLNVKTDQNTVMPRSA